MPASRHATLAAFALLAPVVLAPVWAAAQEPPKPPETSEPVEPEVLEEDLRSLPDAGTWKPGDPVRVVPEGVDPSVVEGALDGPAAVPGLLETDLAKLPASTGSGLAARLDAVEPDAPWTLRALGADFAVYDRSGERLAGPTPLAILWSGTGGACDEVVTAEGDPLAAYDPLAGRWLLGRFVSRQGTPGASLCIGIHDGGPALTGSWSLYSFRLPGLPRKATLWTGEGAYCLDLEGEGVADALELDRPGLLAGEPATLTTRPSACGT